MAESDLEWERRKEQLTAPPILLGAPAIIAAARSETPFLVRGLIPAGAITLFVGAPGAKKSWLAYSLAVAVAQGGSWLGVPTTPHGSVARPGRVLILNYDNPTQELGRRMLRLGLRPEDPIHFHTPEDGVEPLRLPEHADDVLAIVHALSPALVVVDSLRQAHTADENSSKEMAGVMGSLKALRGGGCSVIVVHHANKGGISGVGAARGSGEIAASADCQINVSLQEESDEAWWEKHRTWPMRLTEELVGFRVTDAGDSTRVELA